ncbi:putative protein, putative cytochrome c [Campylobacter iguaniorum]|uniref:multiheme c-type cytochrome n=1 Tax=Campylobacter iguaniorum TaxID=1244531 RepID=UPI00073A4D52|nr:multiheme c-type cytochrome [Campylobacter iguaniorum]ALV24290.1 putative protein, putative cytochrome c [Campylobacter iguaniorum]
MKNLYFILILPILLLANINSQFQDPKLCSACHKDEYNSWKKSLHYKSHDSKNELYKASINYVASRTNKAREEILVECATCHNPKIEVVNMDQNYTFAKLFDIQTSKTKQIDEQIGADHLKNGVSCYICHRIDDIQEDKNGKYSIKWLHGNDMAGPFESSSRAEFHNTVQREYFIKGDKLCLICHQGQGDNNKFGQYNTGKETQASKATKRCVDCHMGKPKEAVNAPHIATNQAEVRRVRSHLFIGSQDKKLLEDTFNISFNQTQKKLIIENKISHNVPTGFGGRVVEAKIFYIAKNKDIISTQTVAFKAKYILANGKETLSYVANGLESDNRFKPFEKKEIALHPIKGAEQIKVAIYYHRISPNLALDLGVIDGEFTDEKLMVERIFNLY